LLHRNRRVPRLAKPPKATSGDGFAGFGTNRCIFWSETMTIKPKAVGAIPTEAASTALTVTDQVRPTFDKTVEGLKQSAATATASLEEAQTQLKQGYDRAMKSAEQFAKFHQGNVEAFMKASQIFATGLQDITKHVAANAQASMEESVSTFRALTTVKSLKEAIDLQTTYAKSAIEKAMAESSKLTETSLKLAEQAYAPLTARVNAAVETFTTR
jgi:phasin family protein